MREIEMKQEELSHVYRLTEVIDMPAVNGLAIHIQLTKPSWCHYFIYDGSGRLRAQYLHGTTPQPVIVHEQFDHTSPYTIHGPIDEGTWVIDIFIQRAEVMTENEYLGKIDISFPTTFSYSYDMSWQVEAGEFCLAVPSNDQIEMRWLKGDFHTHTIYSDGKMTREENMQMARRQALDFFVATDHNLVPTSWCNHDTDILVIPGVEVTVGEGHFNLIGTKTSPFHNFTLEDIANERGMQELLKSTSRDSLISINHPFLSEWKWNFQETELALVDCIEIMNDPTYFENIAATEEALNVWNILLNDGYRITGIGGSDSHLRPDETYEGSNQASLIGDPGTFVYSSLNMKQILNSVKSGQVVVSRGSFLEVTSDDGSIAGQSLSKRVGEIYMQFEEEDKQIEWVLDGQVVQTSVGTTDRFDYAFDDTLAHWIRVDIRDKDNRLYAFSNPFYIGRKAPTLTTWGDVIRVYEEGDA